MNASIHTLFPFPGIVIIMYSSTEFHGRSKSKHRCNMAPKKSFLYLKTFNLKNKHSMSIHFQ